MTVHVAIAGVEYAEVVRDSVEVTETLGAPTTARFVLEDMTSVLASDWYVGRKLADVRIWDTVDTGDLFRGQITAFRASIEGVRRVFEIEAEGYDRLLDYTLVGHETQTYYYATATYVPYADQDAYHQPYVVSEVEPYTADPNANTGIALPARDDKSVVQAFFDTYWRGPTLTYDIVQHGNVDSGSSDSMGAPGSAEGRLYFGQTTLRDVLDQIASLVSGSLAFWIDADLVFHWRVLTPVVGASSATIPSGSTLHTLPRLLPEARDVVFAPYVVGDGGDAPMGTLRLDLPLNGVVDGVYVRAGQDGASGLVDLGTTYGRQAYISAPWVTDAAGRGAAVAYAAAEYGSSGRLTITFETQADWHDLHVGQSLTLYHPTIGVDPATAYIVRQVTTSFRPENVRRLSLQLGDALIRTLSRYGGGGSRKGFPDRNLDPQAVPWPEPGGVDMGYKIALEVQDVSPKAGESQVVYAGYADSALNRIPVAGLRIEWGLVIVTNAGTTTYEGNAATDSALMFYLAAGYSTTATDGRAINTLYAHANATSDDACVVTATYHYA